MTFVGKILVILIMALSLVFLGVSVVAFTTATNWKTETEKQLAEVKKVQDQLTTAKALDAEVQTKFKQAQDEHATAAKNLEGQIVALRTDNEKAQSEITQARTALTDAQTNARLSLEETKLKADEIGKLRDQLSAVTDQSNKFKIQQTELNNEILNLKRMLEVAERNTKSLRETAAKFAKVLTDKGLSTDLRNVQATELPANVEGKVLKVDPSNRRMEISIGSDDGLSVGQELYLYRTSPTAEYLGKVKINVVEPDQAVASVIGNTVNGKKIKEGDDVASTIRAK
jgi:chromosome segregation ATPase